MRVICTVCVTIAPFRTSREGGGSGDIIPAYSTSVTSFEVPSLRPIRTLIRELIEVRFLQHRTPYGFVLLQKAVF
jgi:hypothetical protein